MKILIYGAGVIGCTYGQQLLEAGCEVTVIVKPERKRHTEQNGIHINCSDFRSGKEQTEDIIFKPKVTDTLSADNDFEYIIVSTNSLHLDQILPVLKESAGKAHILFFQNLWLDDFDKIAKYLTSSQYFFGFPFMAGGGRKNSDIHSVISGSKYSKTMLGEANGQVSTRVQQIASVLEKANMKPFISEQIKTWLIPHYIFIACMSCGVMKAKGSMKTFTQSSSLMKEMIHAIREGFSICQQEGYDPHMEKVNRLYYMPLFITIPIVRKIFSDKSMSMMFDNYLEHSADEIEQMIKNITISGKKFDVQLPYLKRILTI